MSPPAYEPIPTGEKLSARLQSQEEEEIYVNEPTSNSRSSTFFRTCIKAVACTIVLLFAVGACFLSGAFIGNELAEIVKPGSTRGGRVETVTERVTVTEKGNWKWWNKRTTTREEEQFSTSTLKDGSTQTFVFTTRPIVNPGGYTIGTLTGYVPVSTQAQDAGPTSNTAEPSKTSQSNSASSSFSSSSSTRSASTIPLSTSSTSPLPSNTLSLTSSSSQSDSWSKVSTTSLSPQPTFASSISKREPQEEEFDFNEVDYHLLHRRGLDFESEPTRPVSSEEGKEEEEEEEEISPSISTITTTSTPTPEPTTTKGVEEFSTSTDRKGGVYTLVKTTRPIMNPGGYVIGTLNGGWVDVDKIKPTPTAAPTTTTPVNRSSSSLSGHHEELRKREILNL